MRRELRDTELRLVLDHRKDLRSAISFWEASALFWEAFNRTSFCSNAYGRVSKVLLGSSMIFRVPAGAVK
jgi:hypothetical protein